MPFERLVAPEVQPRHRCDHLVDLGLTLPEPVEARLDDGLVHLVQQPLRRSQHVELGTPRVDLPQLRARAGRCLTD